MRVRANSGLRYHLERAGSGEPLVLLHGFSGDATTWREIGAVLQDDYALIAIDLPGHGQSESPVDAARYRMESVAADIVDILARLGAGTCHLLGYSMGGRLALYLALHYGERFRCVMLEGASPGLADKERTTRRIQDEALADTIEAEGIEAFVAHWESLPLWATQSESMIRRQRPQRLRNHPLGLANSLRGMGAGAQPNLWRILRRLQLPCLLLAGERDAKYRRLNRQMAALTPRAKLALIPAAGHNTHLEQPEAFCRALLSFLQSL